MDDPFANFPGGNPFPLGSGPNAFPRNGAYLDWPESLKPTYYNQWNLTVQQQIGQDWMASASYVGNSMVHLWGSIQINPATRDRARGDNRFGALRNDLRFQQLTAPQ